MPKKSELKKILILGSGPRITGEISEFDLLTTQAIDTLLSEGIKVVMVNPNPAVISTDKKNNLTVYLEPMTYSFLERILRMETPDAIIATFGSKLALSIANHLINNGLLRELNIRLLNMPINNWSMFTNNNELVDFLHENQLPATNSHILSLDDLMENRDILLEKLDFPQIIRPVTRNEDEKFSTLNNEAEFISFVDQLKDEYKDSKRDIEYELRDDLSTYSEYIIDAIADEKGNVNIVSSAEAIDPLRINTGDSIIVAPIQTINNKKIQELREDVVQIIELLKLTGIVSVRFAINKDDEYSEEKIVGVYPRITRSSIFAYRSGTLSIGSLVAKLSLGYLLDEIIDPVTGQSATIEPIIDNVVVRVPVWSFSDLGNSHYYLGNKMQSSGEAIGFGRNFCMAIIKGFLSSNLTIQEISLQKYRELSMSDIYEQIDQYNENHLLLLLELLSRDIDLKEVSDTTHINQYFLENLREVTHLITNIATKKGDFEVLQDAKFFGIPDFVIADLWKITEEQVCELREARGVVPGYRHIDFSAGLLPTKTNAYYTAYEIENEVEITNTRPTILIVGLNPFQISQNSEYDYTLFHAINVLKESGFETILLSNNSESISSNYELVDRLYFDPITLENILNIAKIEKPEYVLTQFSGKGINALVPILEEHGLKILGRNIDDEFLGTKEALKKLLEELELPTIPSTTSTNKQDIINFVKTIGFPVLVGGQRFNRQRKSAVVYDEDSLFQYLDESDGNLYSASQFIDDRKYEVIAISDGDSVTIPGIIEHLEQTGSHASDSIAVFSPQHLDATHQRTIRDMIVEISSRIHIKGFVNFNFLIQGDNIYILQIKAYAGHNIAFLSKSLGQNLSKIATQVLLGQKLPDLNLPADIWFHNNLIHVKMPVFSKLGYNSDDIFDSSMKATSSVMGRDTELNKALYKGYEAAGLPIPSYGNVFISVNDTDKSKIADLAIRFKKLGFKLYATTGTAEILANNGVTVKTIAKIQSGNDSIIRKLNHHQIDMVINTVSFSEPVNRDAVKIRDAALNNHIPVFSRIESANYILEVLESLALTTKPM